MSLNHVIKNLPCAWHADKCFLVHTLSESYELYKDWCKPKGIKEMPFSTFYRLKPKDVFLIGDIPDKDCLCKPCLNSDLLVRAIHKYNIKGVSNSPKDMIKMTLCTIHETDVSFTVYPEYGYYDCI